MFLNTVDDIIRREVETVRARRVILDQLEGGPKTGSELRESIRKDMMARSVKDRGKKVHPEDFRVTDPKLYFNTKHLENVGIVVSRKVSQQRIFSLDPRAVQPVRRVLRITRPKCMITSLTGPEDQRRLMRWIFRERRFAPKVVHVVVEAKRFSKGVAKHLERFIPDSMTRKWKNHWHELPEGIVGDTLSAVRGDLMATYDEIEKIVLGGLQEYEVIVNLSYGPPVIVLAMSLLAMEYSLTAIHLDGFKGDSPILTQVLPRE